MNGIFSGSKELTHILQWYNYSLYDITALGRVEPLSWDEIAINEPAQEHLFSHKYLLVPIPKEDEKLQQAYAKYRADGFFPILRIPEKDLEKRICPDLHASYGITRQNHRHYLLHELYFEERGISAFSSPGVYLRHPSRLAIPIKKAVEIFSRYFAVAQFTDKGVKLRNQQKIYVN